MIFNIRTPLFHYWERYGYPKDTWCLGLNKAEVDLEAIKGKSIKVKYWKHKDVFTIKPSIVQKYPVERIKGGEVEVYIIPVTILGKTKKQQIYDKYNSMTPEEQWKFTH